MTRFCSWYNPDRRGGAIRGLVLVLLCYGVLAFGVTYPISTGVTLGLVFAAFCFWKAWKLRGKNGPE